MSNTLICITITNEPGRGRSNQSSDINFECLPNQARQTHPGARSSRPGASGARRGLDEQNKRKIRGEQEQHERNTREHIPTSWLATGLHLTLRWPWAGFPLGRPHRWDHRNLEWNSASGVCLTSIGGRKRRKTLLMRILGNASQISEGGLAPVTIGRRLAYASEHALARRK